MSWLAMVPAWIWVVVGMVGVLRRDGAQGVLWLCGFIACVTALVGGTFWAIDRRRS